MSGIKNNIVFSNGEKLQPSTSADITQMNTLSTDISRINYTGNPEGVVAANPASLCHDPVSGNIYFKQSGTGNTGWQLIAGEAFYPLIGALEYFPNANGDSYLTSGVWLKANGQILSQATYTVLFSRIGYINPGATYWTARSSTTTTGLSGIVYNSGLYVVSGTGYAGYSTDAITWTFNPIGHIITGSDVAFGNNVYVTIGSSGQILRSTDAISWYSSCPQFGTSASQDKVLIWSGSIFVSCGSMDIFSSTDGLNYACRFESAQQIISLAFGNGKYIAVGNSGTIVNSSNGLSWTAQTSGTLSNLYAAGYGNNLYLAAGAGGTLRTSTDSITWGGKTSNTASSILTMTYGSVYVYGGNGGVVGSSTDATTWTVRTSNTTSTVNALVYGTVYVYGTNGGGIGSSTDATTWTARTSNTASAINTLAYNGSVYVYGGVNGTLGYSTDATTWTAITPLSTSTIYSITYNGTIFVGAVNAFNKGATIESTDGITWTVYGTGYLASNSAVVGITFGNGLFVIGGAAGLLYTSTDALTWTSRTSNTASQINNLIYANSTYGYVGVNGAAGYSTDAITWTAVSSGATSTINGLTYGNGLFVYSGGGGILATSTDFITWTSRTSGTTSTIYSLAYGGHNYVFGGVGGMISNSYDAITWSAQTSAVTSNMIDIVSGGGLYVGVGATGAIQSALADFAYDPATQFQLPTDANIALTVETITNFKRNLYIKVL